MSGAEEGRPSQHPPRPDFAGIYREQAGYVRRTLQRLGVPSRHLDDAMQDVFCVALRRLPEYKERDRLPSWLAAIASRVASPRVQRTWFLPAVRTDSDAADDGPPEPTRDEASPETAVGNRRLALYLLQSIGAQERRIVFVMHHVDAMPVPEIAGALEIPTGTAYTRLRRATQEVEAAWRRLQARERPSSDAAVLPALAVLLVAEREIAPLPAGVAERVWEGLQRTSAWRAANGAGRHVDHSWPRARTAAGLVAAFVAGIAVDALWHPLREAPRLDVEPEAAALVALPTLPPASPPASPSVQAQPDAFSSRDSAPPPSGGPTDSARERILIDRASLALAAGDASGALQAVQEHARAFPAGAFVEKRERLWIQALVRTGRLGEARQRVEAFARTHPRSRAVDALRKAVGAPAP